MKIFISHIAEEAPVAQVLKDWTESAFIGQCDVFVSSSEVDVPAGSRWLEVMEAALSQSKALLVLCSPQSIHRPWINFESGCGWIKRVPILPICHSGQRKNDLPTPLSLFQGLELDDPQFPGSLISSLTKHLGFARIPRIDQSAMRDELRVALNVISSDAGAAVKRSDTIESEFELGLRNLTPGECKVFASFMHQDSKVSTFYAGLSSNLVLVAQALATRGYLYLISESHDIWFQQFTYCIREPVFAYFKANPEVLEACRESDEVKTEG